MVTNLATEASSKQGRVMIRKLVMAALLLPALAAFAANKDTEPNLRTVQGVVSNAQGDAVNGAVVQLKNTKTLQIRSFITRDNGTYYFHGLGKDVDYELRADYQGAASGTKTLSSFDSRKLAIINLKLGKQKSE